MAIEHSVSPHGGAGKSTLGREDKCMGPSVMKTGPGWLSKGSPMCLEQ